MSNDQQLGPVEESLRRSFAPPDLSALEASIDAAARDQAARDQAPVVDELAPRRRQIILVAVVAAAAAALALLLLRPSNTKPQPQVAKTTPRHEFGANLAQFVSDRQLPAVVSETSCRAVRRPPTNCVDDTVKPWLPANDRVEVLAECGAPEGPTCASSGLQAGTGIQLRMLPAGPRFLVCMDPVAKDRQPLLPESSGLNLFRRQLGNYVIYEITPLSKPQTLPLFKL